jgi:replicative DNA helicase
MNNQLDHNRIPPHNLDAEKSVLGAMMISSKAAYRATGSEGLQPTDFYFGAHAKIFEAMADLLRENKGIDLVTVCDKLERMDCLDAVGGYAYMADISTFVPTAANIQQYIDVIKEYSERRAVIDLCGKASMAAFDKTSDFEEEKSELQTGIFSVSQHKSKKGFRKIGDIVIESLSDIEEAFNHPGEIMGIKTYYPALDNVLHGLQKGNLVIVAARPGMGKTAIAQGIALNVARYTPGSVVAVFDLEMPDKELTKRWLSSVSKVEHTSLNTGKLNNDDWDSLSDAADRIGGTNLFIDDSAGITVMDMMGKCQQLKMEQKRLDLIVIDYLQLITSASKRKNGTRENEVSEITRSIKVMAMELDVPVLLLSQLSRKCEERSNKMPLLSDLRESGSIEQDADIVMFIYRHSYYHPDCKDPDKVEINIAKFRNGSTGIIEMGWNPKLVSFYDRARQDEPLNKQVGMKVANEKTPWN